MTAYGYMRGNRIEYSEAAQKWYYADTGEFIDLDHERPCTLCHKPPTHEGYDACLGELPGVLNACCGHGVEDGYIHYEKLPFWMTNKNHWPLVIASVSFVPYLFFTALVLTSVIRCKSCDFAMAVRPFLLPWSLLFLILLAGLTVAIWIRKRQVATSIVILSKILKALKEVASLEDETAVE